jgi:competence protein ComFC
MADVFPRMAGLKRAALDLLFPRWCIGCGREGDYICGACRQGLPVITPPVCDGCGRPLDDRSGGMLCPACAGVEARIDGIRSPFLFDGVLRRAIHEFKYNNLRALAPVLAGMLHGYMMRNPLPGEVLVPVPLHPRRLRERGYNQSALLARELGRLSVAPVVEGCLVRRGYAPPQVGSAGVAERRRNVATAFACRDRRLAGRKVILIDDVSTSGATLNSCAAVLKAAGAASVWGLVMALEK